jgi:simple sugar transport system substrate-binding protein
MKKVSRGHSQRRWGRWTTSIGAALLAFGLAGTALTPAAVSEESEKPLIIMLGNSASEAFWQPVIKGFEQAGEDLGFEARFRAPGPKGYASAYEYTLAVENAIASKPDALIIADTRPEAMNDTIKSAVDMGIPVILSNSGFGQQKIVGALAFIGMDEWLNGRVGGEQLKKTGAKHALIATTAPGIPDIDNRVAGFIEGFEPGKTTLVEVPEPVLFDTPKLVNAMMATLEKDETIDSIFSTGGCCAPAMLIARERLGERGKSMHFGTIDLGDPVVRGLVDGKLDFALDYQQYHQGYLPAVFLIHFIRYGITPGTDFIPTGPGIITPENAQQIIELSAQNFR